ncbi:MAG: cation diffusion facilitator family transporter, partial [Rhodospirillaceae bacterium]
HMAADAGVTVGVIVAALGIAWTGWLWLDPAVGLLIAAAILAGTWGLLRESVALAADAVPPGVDVAAVRAFLEGQAGVRRVHDLHVWALGTTEVALTAHLEMPGGHPGDHFLDTLQTGLAARFGIGHATLQVEIADDCACRLAPDHLV